MSYSHRRSAATADRMGHRLITWWNKDNVWHRAAALAALRVYGAVFHLQDAAVVVGEMGDGGEPQLPPSQEHIHASDGFPPGRNRPCAEAGTTEASVSPRARQAT